MNKNFKRIISLLLIISFVLPNINVFANYETYNPIEIIEENLGEHLDENINIENENINNYDYTNNNEDQPDALENIFNSLTPEAKKLLLDTISQTDKELLELHKEYVDTELELEYNEAPIRKGKAVATVTDTLNQLSRDLSALGLSSEVRYALMGAASSIVAGMGTFVSTVGIGTIIAAITATACITVLIINWNTVSSKWNGITSAFQKAFSSSSTNVSSAFSSSKTTVNNQSKEIGAINGGIYKNGTFPASASKHIALSTVSSIIRSTQKPFEIYYSTTKRIVLLKYRVNNGIKSDINILYGKTGSPYDKTNYEIGGATLYVLYDMKSNKIFHAHLRLSNSRYNDTIVLRKSNSLDWQIYPLPSKRDMTYYNLKEIGALFPGDQLK